MRNDEFELPDGSYFALDIKVYIKYIIKNISLKIYPFAEARPSEEMRFYLSEGVVSDLALC